jgi:hypothetical protein
MAAIKTSFGSGGAGLTPGDSAGSPDLATALRDIADDMTELRTQFVALLAKLDADTGTTDSDYESTLTPAALTHTKG